MSDNKSASVALISNISERDRAKDVEQFDDILRTFIHDTNKFENRFGIISDEEKMESCPSWKHRLRWMKRIRTFEILEMER